MLDGLNDRRIPVLSGKQRTPLLGILVLWGLCCGLFSWKLSYASIGGPRKAWHDARLRESSEPWHFMKVFGRVSGSEDFPEAKLNSTIFVDTKSPSSC